VAYSFITGRDQRNDWRMLGWDYSARADSQLSALFPLLVSTAAATQFYAFDDICSGNSAGRRRQHLACCPAYGVLNDEAAPTLSLISLNPKMRCWR
tara:strand:- start:8407 stop:8694 length:288 start_codon:yes stop_codon:yes gene_type:complete